VERTAIIVIRIIQLACTTVINIFVVRINSHNKYLVYTGKLKIDEYGKKAIELVYKILKGKTIK